MGKANQEANQEVMAKLVELGQQKINKTTDVSYEVPQVGTLQLQVRERLSLSESVFFVNQAVEIIRGANGIPMPEIVNFVVPILVLEQFAGITLPEDVDSQYALMVGAGLYQCVIGFIDEGHLRELQDSIHYRLANDAKERAFLKFEGVLSKVSDMLENIGGLTGAMGEEDLGNAMELIRGFASKEGTAEEKATSLYLEEMRKKTAELERKKQELDGQLIHPLFAPQGVVADSRRNLESVLQSGDGDNNSSKENKESKKSRKPRKKAKPKELEETEAEVVELATIEGESGLKSGND